MRSKILWIVLAIVACKNSNKETSPVVTGETEHTLPQNGFDPAKAVDIIGTWVRKSTHYDANNNKVLDETERQKEGPALGFDYFLFKNDGSCVRDKDIRFNGTYDIIEKNSVRNLQIETDPPGETYKYSITGPVTDEMVLHNSGVFLVFKKE